MQQVTDNMQTFQDAPDYAAIPAPDNYYQVLVVYDLEVEEAHAFGAASGLNGRMFWHNHAVSLAQITGPIFYTILNLPNP